MNLTLHLSTELGARLCAQAKAVGKAPEELALQALQEQLDVESPPAAMQRHGLTHLLTFNVEDFRRYPGIQLLAPQEIAVTDGTL